MSDGALRGTRLGATSYETDNHVELAPRQPVSYDCPNGHVTTMPFSLEAEVPLVWECRCGSEALLRDGDRPEPKVAKHVRTHWDMLMERRTTADLEVLLTERLDLLRNDAVTSSAGRKSAPRRKKTA
ncbi:MAG: RNA polymerase-binding protein RbpA [Candidatus Nanopelagicales bacterium]